MSNKQQKKARKELRRQLKGAMERQCVSSLKATKIALATVLAFSVVLIGVSILEFLWILFK